MRKTLLAMTMLGMTGTASADFLGLYVGAGSWSHDPSGSFESTVGSSTQDIDMQNNVGLSKESEAYLWLAFDHPIPVLPNIRLERTPLLHQGTTSISGNFNGQSFNVSEPATVDLTSTDVIPYYRLLDNWVNLDVGLVIRKLDGEFTIGTSTQEFSETVPMVYLAAQFDLPLSGLSVGADLKSLSFGDDSYSDVRLRALYEMGVVGFELGTRTTNITLKDASNINADIDFKGMMFGMYLHF
jgi:outer membrane protein